MTVKRHEYGKLEIYGNLKAIPSNAFGYSNIESIEIPEGVVEILDFAFVGTHLTKLVLPNSLTHIGNSIFTEDSESYDVGEVHIPNMTM